MVNPPPPPPRRIPPPLRIRGGGQICTLGTTTFSILLIFSRYVDVLYKDLGWSTCLFYCATFIVFCCCKIRKSTMVYYNVAFCKNICRKLSHILVHFIFSPSVSPPISPIPPNTGNSGVASTPPPSSPPPDSSFIVHKLYNFHF